MTLSQILGPMPPPNYRETWPNLQLGLKMIICPQKLLKRVMSARLFSAPDRAVASIAAYGGNPATANEERADQEASAEGCCVLLLADTVFNARISPTFFFSFFCLKHKTGQDSQPTSVLHSSSSAEVAFECL